ncbi:hypothetical protein SK128_010003 [Halocaridina rubra]|uniref:TIR domain-containing protein n=1 Tax=Halocaridina rubra TaxID=373956 RepID=A0AAN8XFD5_HALRR
MKVSTVKSKLILTNVRERLRQWKKSAMRHLRSFCSYRVRRQSLICQPHHELIGGQQSYLAIEETVKPFLDSEQPICNSVARKRGKQLHEDNIHHWVYTILATQEDSEQARQIQKALQNTSVKVFGPWNIRLGSDRMDSWRRILRTSKAVVILVSKALLKDSLLCTCIPEVMADGKNKYLVPMFLEPISEYEVPLWLRPLFMIQGIRMNSLGLKESARKVHT